MNLPKIIVLMSTYNGEKYLKVQLDSILAQKGVSVEIFVRDDGSSDNTLKILQQYATQNKLRYYVGHNLGPAKSFMDLIYNAPEANYYAFSDQDDYWLSDKLKQAIEHIKIFDIGEQKPCLYYGKTFIVDKNLSMLPHKDTSTIYTTFQQAVVCSNAIGCTFVFNRKLLKIVQQYSPGFIIMHDAWLHKLCLSIGGSLYYDSIPHIYYRQHENNVCGGKKKSLRERLRRYLQSWFYRPGIRYAMLEELLKGYGTRMPLQNYNICQKVLDYKKGWKYKLDLLKDKTIRTGNKRVDYRYILNVLLGRF